MYKPNSYWQIGRIIVHSICRSWSSIGGQFPKPYDSLLNSNWHGIRRVVNQYFHFGVENEKPLPYGVEYRRTIYIVRDVCGCQVYALSS